MSPHTLFIRFGGSLLYVYIYEYNRKLLAYKIQGGLIMNENQINEIIKKKNSVFSLWSGSRRKWNLIFICYSQITRKKIWIGGIHIFIYFDELSLRVFSKKKYSHSVKKIYFHYIMNFESRPQCSTSFANQFYVAFFLEKINIKKNKKLNIRTTFRNKCWNSMEMNTSI